MSRTDRVPCTPATGNNAEPCNARLLLALSVGGALLLPPWLAPLKACRVKWPQVHVRAGSIGDQACKGLASGQAIQNAPAARPARQAPCALSCQVKCMHLSATFTSPEIAGECRLTVLGQRAQAEAAHQQLCPLAMKAPGEPGTAPMTGTPSCDRGRKQAWRASTVAPASSLDRAAAVACYNACQPS